MYARRNTNLHLWSNLSFLGEMISLKLTFRLCIISPVRRFCHVNYQLISLCCAYISISDCYICAVISMCIDQCAWHDWQLNNSINIHSMCVETNVYAHCICDIFKFYIHVYFNKAWYGNLRKNRIFNSFESQQLSLIEHLPIELFPGNVIVG